LVLCCAGMGLYGPGSLSAMGSFYRSREQYLPGGMYLYFAFSNAAAFVASIFMGYAAMRLNWQQGGMLAGILMMTGHVYLLVIARVFQEDKLPAFNAVTLNEDGDRKPEYRPWPNLLLAMFCFAFFSFAMKMGHNGVSAWAGATAGMRDWSYLGSLMVMLLGTVAALAGSIIFTRHLVPERILIGYGFMAAVFAGLIAPGYIGLSTPSIPASVHIGIALFVLLAVVLSEFLVLAPLYSMLLRNGGRYTNTLIGLAAVLGYLPYFAVLFPDSAYLNSARGLAFVVVSVPVLVLGGWWLLKSAKKAPRNKAI
jgi:hypothetical protein